MQRGIGHFGMDFHDEIIRIPAGVVVHGNIMKLLGSKGGIWPRISGRRKKMSDLWVFERIGDALWAIYGLFTWFLVLYVIRIIFAD